MHNLLIWIMYIFMKLIYIHTMYYKINISMVRGWLPIKSDTYESFNFRYNIYYEQMFQKLKN